MSKLQVRERERERESERERETVFCIYISGPTEYSFFISVLYKPKMVQLCSTKMKLPLCTIISHDTESGFLLFKE